MDVTGEKEKFLSFIKEYVGFFDEMVEMQKEQLAAVISSELPRVERSATSLQTYLKKLGSLEQKRIELQEKAGFEDMTFNEIIDSSPEDEKQDLSKLFDALSKGIADVVFYNSKSQEKVRNDLLVMGGEESGFVYNAQKKHVSSEAKEIVFEAKA